MAKLVAPILSNPWRERLKAKYSASRRNQLNFQANPWTVRREGRGGRFGEGDPDDPFLEEMIHFIFFIFHQVRGKEEVPGKEAGGGGGSASWDTHTLTPTT